jgi:type IV pilus assembly protein PilW
MRQLRRQAGLTLVELMVATTLSLVLLAGVLLVFQSNKATYQMQSGLGTLQENGRYAISQIAADLQQTGFGGCQSPRLSPRVINVVTPSPASAYLDDVAQGEFFDGRNDQAGSVTYGGVTMVTGTDSIEIRGPLRSNVAYVNGPVLKTGNIVVRGNTTGFAANEYLMIGDCSSSTLFRATAVTASAGSPPTTTITHTSGNTSGELAQPYSSDALVMEFGTHTYFVGTTPRTNANGQAITALYRFDGNSSVELVDGVEDMQIEYAFDGDGNGEIDGFGTVDDITGGSYDWDQVMAVRISLLMNSVEGASSVEAPYTYFPAGSTSISPSSGDYRLRQEFSSLISIRNAVF